MQQARVFVIAVRKTGDQNFPRIGDTGGGAGGSAHHRLKALEAGLSRMGRGTRCLPFAPLRLTE